MIYFMKLLLSELIKPFNKVIGSMLNIETALYLEKKLRKQQEHFQKMCFWSKFATPLQLKKKLVIKNEKHSSPSKVISIPESHRKNLFLQNR